MNEKSIISESAQLFYKEYINKKNNDTIVILHWWWWKSDSWVEVWSILHKQWYNVIIPDLPGFWKSELIDIHWLNDYAKTVENLVKVLWLKNIILLWHSNWGAISIKIENRWKIKIKKLILNNSAWIRKKASITFKKVVFKILSYPFKLIKNIPWVDKLRVVFYKLIWARDYIMCEKNENLHWTLKNMLNSDLKDNIKNIKTETLIIWWDIDTYTPVLDWYKMNKWIKKSKLIILKKQKHGIHLHSPILLAQTIITNIK